MNLNNLKPAWRQFRLSNSMQVMNQKEIIHLLESAERRTEGHSYGLTMNAIMFILLTLCCQGG